MRSLLFGWLPFLCDLNISVMDQLYSPLLWDRAISYKPRIFKTLQELLLYYAIRHTLLRGYNRIDIN